MTFSLRAVAAVVVVAGIVVFTASVESEGGVEGAGRGSVWLGGVCALNLAPNIKINNVCVRCVCGCVEGRERGRRGCVTARDKDKL